MDIHLSQPSQKTTPMQPSRSRHQKSLTLLASKAGSFQRTDGGNHYGKSEPAMRTAGPPVISPFQ